MQETMTQENPYSSDESFENYIDSIIRISKENSYGMANIPVRKDFESKAKDLLKEKGYKPISKYAGIVTFKL